MKLLQFSVAEQYFLEAKVEISKNTINNTEFTHFEKAYLHCYKFEWKQAIGSFLQAENFIECKDVYKIIYNRQNLL